MIGSDFSCAVWSRALGCDSICIYSVDYLIIFFQASISYLCYLLIAYCHLVRTGILLLLRNFSKLFWLSLTSIFVNTIQHNETQ